MKLRRIVPLASLAIVTGIVAAATFFAPPPDFPFTEPPPGSAAPRIELGLGQATLFGRVVDADGQPVQNAGVTLKDGQRPVYDWTGSDGTFQLDQVTPRAHRVLVTALGFMATGFDLDEWPKQTEAEPFEFTLDRRVDAPPTLEGLRLSHLVGGVTFGPLANPDAGYELYMLPTGSPSDPTGGFPRRVPIDATGAFRIDHLSAGEYRVILLGPEDRGGSEPDLLAGADGEPQLYTHGAGDGQERLTLNSTAGAINGRVVRTQNAADDPADDAAGDALPSRAVRGAFVRAERFIDQGVGLPNDIEPGNRRVDSLVDGARFRAARSDADGAFTLTDLQPGLYRLSMIAGADRVDRVVTVMPASVVDVALDLR